MKKMFALLVSFILTAAAAMPALAAPPPDATVLFGGEGVGTFGVSGATYTENTLPSGWVSDSTYDGTTKTITYPEEEGNRYAKVSALSNTAATLNYKPAENIGLDSYFVWEAKLRIPEQAGGYVRDKSVTFYFTQWNANNFGITFKGNSSGEDAQKGKILITSDVIASSPYNTGISYEQGKWYTVQLAFHRADGQTQVILFLDGNYIHTFDLAGSNGTPYQTFNINRFSISCSPTYDTNPSSIEIDDVFAYTPSVSGSTEIAFSPAGNSGIVLNEETKTLAWEGDLTVSDLRSKLSFTAGSFRSVLADGKTLGDSEVIPNGATIVLAAADGYTFAEYTADVETSARAKDYFENKDGSFDSDLAYTAVTRYQVSSWYSLPVG